MKNGLQNRKYKPYVNQTGHSGVIAYRIEDDAIAIKFAGGAVYTYDSEAPGFEHVEQMKRLAEKGRGLATYINQFVRGNYSRRIH